jgi:hypothetical protein
MSTREQYKLINDISDDIGDDLFGYILSRYYDDDDDDGGYDRHGEWWTYGRRNSITQGIVIKIRVKSI